MKKSILFFLISILAIANLHAFSGKGSGTEEDPFQITNVKQLQEIENNLDAHYILMNDIDAKETKYWNNIDHDNDSTTPMKAMGFDPIGYHAPSHTLIFDGKDHAIKNLHIFIPWEDQVGLFATVLNDCEIRNIKLDDCFVDGKRNVGSLVGTNYGLVINSSVSGTVSGLEFVGGMVGSNYGGVVKSSADVEVIQNIWRGQFYYAGGLVGYNDGSIVLSYSNGIVKPEYMKIDDAGIQTSEYIGGLAGRNGGIIRNSYTSADISGDKSVGGLVGVSSGKVYFSYSTGKVGGDETAGGFRGSTQFLNIDSIFNCFWDIESSEHETSSGGTGKNSAEMKNKSTFTDVGWNFDFIWGIDENINNGYPYIKYDKSYHPTDTDGDGYTNLSTFTDLHWFSEGGFNQHNKWELDSDIDATDSKNLNDGRGFWSIGTMGNAFKGILNGNNYEIRNLFINREREIHIGLFGVVNHEGEIKNVEILDYDICAYQKVGGLVGYNLGIIVNSKVSGNINGFQSIGGFVGFNSGNISNSNANCVITGIIGDHNIPPENIGGLVGSNIGNIEYSHSAGNISEKFNIGGLVGMNNGYISFSNSSATIIGDDAVGGLVGYNVNGYIQKSYSTGSVKGNTRVGGLVGFNYGKIQNTYARGSVEGNSLIGGLVGQIQQPVIDDRFIEKSYSTGRIISNSQNDNGGLTGYNPKSSIHQCLWDSVTSGMGTSFGGYGKNTAQMKTKSTFTTFGFDFNTTWSIDPDINDGYPYLQIKTVSVQETPDAKSLGISLSPNPANEFVKISIEEENGIILDVRIVDLIGRLIKDGNVASGSREIIIPVSEIVNGYYLVRIQTNREYISLPLIVE